MYPSIRMERLEGNGRPDRLLGWMGVLADPTRLRLLHLLERRELGVAELCAVLRLPQSTVSRHLKVLSDQRWLGARTRGTSRLYRLAGGLDAGNVRQAIVQAQPWGVDACSRLESAPGRKDHKRMARFIEAALEGTS